MKKIGGLIIIFSVLILFSTNVEAKISRNGYNFEVEYNGNQITRINLSPYRSSGIVYIGTTARINVTDSIEGMKWTWSSKNENVATISEAGEILPISRGKVVFVGKCTYQDESYKIRIQTYVRHPKLPAKKVSLIKGQTFTAGIVGINATSFKSSNKKIAKVISKGVVKAKKAGICTIKIKGENNTIYKLKVVVEKPNNNGTGVLKDENDNEIIRFNKLNKKNTGYKVTKVKNKYLNKTSVDYYCVELDESGNYVSVQLTAEPIIDVREYFGYDVTIDENTYIGPLGKLKGYCAHIYGEDIKRSRVPSITTKNGGFTGYSVSYIDSQQELLKEYIFYVMEKDGYYITVCAKGGSYFQVESINMLQALFGK